MLQDLTERIARLFDGREAIGFDVIFDLGDEGMIHVLGSAQPIIVSNAGDAADTVFRIGPADLMSMLTGELAPMMAYMQGKLKVDGDLNRAMQLSSLFARAQPDHPARMNQSKSALLTIWWKRRDSSRLIAAYALQ